MKVTIVVRKLGVAEPEYALPFELPEVPRVDSYISIYCPAAPGTNGRLRSSDDLVVRHVWWELQHLTDDPPIFDGPGKALETTIECDHAIGPLLDGRKRDLILREAEAKKIDVERFDVARVRVGAN